MSQSLSIALASDENYLDGVAGTLSGVARSNPATPIEAVILDCGIHDASWSALEKALLSGFPHLNLVRLRIHPDRLRVFNPTNTGARLNNSAYARLLLPELLPDHDRILYLDSDLLVDADLRPLFAVSLEGASVGAVPETHLPLLRQNLPLDALPDTDTADLAFNSGVLLMDLSALRRAGLIDQILSLPPSIQLKFQDQATLNYVLRGHWKPLPARWNRQQFVTENFSIYRDHPDSVWHFIGQMKPWHFDPSSVRGLVADFQRDVISTGWIPRLRGTERPLSSTWRDFTKAARALALRHARGFCDTTAL